MILFFRNWCEEIIISSFIVTILEMIVPEGSIKKYIRVVTGVYMIFVILSPWFFQLNQLEIEQELNQIFEVQESDEGTKIEEGYEILNTISNNLRIKEEENAGEIQE